LPVFDETAKDAESLGVVHAHAFAHALAGLCLLEGRRAEARVRFERALAVNAKDSRARALAFEGLARVELAERNFDAAAARAADAIGTSLRLRDGAGAGVAAEVLLRAVPIERAVVREDVARAVVRPPGMKTVGPALAETLVRAGTLVSSGSPSLARRRFRMAVRLANAAGDDALVATAAGNLGSIEMRRGAVRFARELLVVAYERARRSGHAVAELVAATNLAQAKRFGADLRGARSLYAKALAIAKRVGRESERGIIISNMARIAAAAGDHERALAGDIEALAIHRKTGPPRALATDLNNLGATLMALRRFDEAEKAFVEARAICARIGAHEILEAVLFNHGYLEKQRGRAKEARALYEEALATLRRAESHVYEAAVLSNLAWLDADEGRCDAAMTRFGESFALAKKTGLVEEAWTALYGEAHCAEKLGDVTRARARLDEAIALIEAQRGGLAGGSRGGQLFSAKTHHVYRDAIELALDAGEPHKAFELAERARARTLVDALAGGRRAGAARGASADALSKVRAAAAQVAAAERALAAAEIEGGVGEGRRNVEEARRRHDEALEAAGGRASAAQSIVGAKGLSALQRELEDDEAILEVAFLRRAIALFVVRKQSFRAVRSPVSVADVLAHVRAFRASVEAVQRGRAGARWKKALRGLHAATITPVRAELAGAKRVYVVPARALNLVPFAAFLDGDRALVEDHAVAYLPSASVLPHVRASLPASPRVVAVGNPRFARADLAALPAAELEAKSVAALFAGGEALVGGAAKESRVKQAAATADILHLATHGEVNGRAPLFSGVYLAPGEGDDGRLEVHEILRSDFRASLVVLSACETAVQTGLAGTLPAGEELVGLVAALLEAGASSVAASLWQVADASTAQLFDRFYRALRGSGRAGALREAQLELRKVKPHPFYWAPFVLVGDGR
jgi:CHAT domain-containing protein/tetratricopeptide (TPR) repeat protein